MADKLSKLEGNKFYISNNGGKDWEYVKDLTPAEVNQYEYAKAEKQAGYGEKEAYGIKGLARLNMLRKRVGLPELSPESSNASDIEKTVRSGIKELQEHSASKYKNVVYDYMINKNPKPNNKLIKAWQKANNSKETPTIADVQKSVSEGKLGKEDVVDAYKDQQWWFRAIAPERVYKPKDEYEKLMQRQGFVEQDGKKYWQDTADKPYEYTEYYTDEEGKPAEETSKTTTTPGPGAEVTKEGKREIVRNPLQTRLVKERAPWWLQDIVKVAGAAGDLARIKRYTPWQAFPTTYLPEATFYDPTRELGANAEQANIQTQGLAAFTGPQALSARSSAIQGQALKNAADIMGRYNNLNVGLANQFNQERTNILNTAAQNKANLETQMFDKYTILNQQFDNSKAMARQNVRQSYIDAITNRAKTQALNTLYPNYQVDPESGGFVNFANTGYTPTPETAADNSPEAMWQRAQKIDPNNAVEIFKTLMSNKGSKSQGSDYPYQGYDNLG